MQLCTILQPPAATLSLYYIFYTSLFIPSAAQAKKDIPILSSLAQGLKIFKRFLELMKRGWMLFLELLWCYVQHVGVFAVRVKSEETAELRKNNIARPGDAAGRVRSTFFWPLKTGAVRAGGKGARLPLYNMCECVSTTKGSPLSVLCVSCARSAAGQMFFIPTSFKGFRCVAASFF